MRVGVKLVGRSFEVEGLLFDVVSLLVRVVVAGVHGFIRNNINIFLCLSIANSVKDEETNVAVVDSHEEMVYFG